ncbi:MAG: hypothetical protein OZ914_10730 [Anaerolineaceae bacterium]|nr:hypothetical protein [Anaerolineaceae bacterium]
MKHIRIIWASTVLVALLSACGSGQPTVPTVSVEEVQGTAVAAALTIVAETQAAIPTNTPIPPTETPTETPPPTETALLLPTVEQVMPTNTLASASGDYCATRVLGTPKGNGTTIKIVNSTKSPVRISLYLNKTALDECGYRSYDLGKNGDAVVITDLVYGCYNLWAWSLDNKHAFNSAGYGCINNPDKWTFEIKEDSIKFH